MHDTINRLAKGGRGGAPPGERARSRLGPRATPRSCGRCSALLRPRRSCRCTASTGCWRRTRGSRATPACPPSAIVIAENGSVVELSARRALASSTGRGGHHLRRRARRRRRQGRRAARRRHLAEDGVLIVVATIGAQNGREVARARGDRARLRGAGRAARRGARRGRARAARVPRRGHQRDQAPAGAPSRRARAARSTTGRGGGR